MLFTTELPTTKVWAIEPQVEKQGKEEVPVLCKHVKFHPVEQHGKTVGFGLLRGINLRVNVRHYKNTGECHSVKLHYNENRLGKKHLLSICEPDKFQDYKEVRSKSVKQVTDRIELTEPIKVPGERVQFDVGVTDAHAKAAIAKRFGGDEEMAKIIMDLIGERLAEILAAYEVSKAKKAEKDAAKAAKLAKKAA